MRRTRGMLVVVLVAAAAVIAPESPAHADPQQPWALRTIAGGPGQGPATTIAVRPDAIAFRPTDGHLLVLGDAVLRSVDLGAGSATIVAGTGLDEPLTEQTHASPANALYAGPARVASIRSVHHMAVRPDGSAVLSGYDPSNWTAYEISAADRIRSTRCCTEYQGEVIPDGGGGYYYTTGAAYESIRHLAADGSDVVIAGGNNNSPWTCPVGPALSATIDALNIAQMVLDPDGNLVFAEPECVVRYDATTGNLVRVAGSDFGTGSTGDGGQAVNAHLDSIRGIAYDSAGDLFIATGPEVREVGTDGIITTVAGNGTTLPGYYGSPDGPAPRTGAEIGDGGPAIASSIDATGVAVSGNRLAIIDRTNNRVRLVSPIAPNATITTVVGDGWTGSDRYTSGAPAGRSSDGPALDVQFGPFGGVATASDGTRYVATGWNTIAAIGVDGILRTVAGTGVAGHSPDGATAATSPIDFPYGVAVGADGTVYFVDHYDHIRAITTAGTLTTLVGGGTDPGDGVTATAAKIAPEGRMAVDAQGRIFWPETYDGDVYKPRIRMWSPSSGLVTTVAGGGSSTSDGLALSASLNGASALTLTPDGRLLFNDSERLRAVVGAGTPSAVVATLAGVAGHNSCTAPPGGSGSIATQTYLRGTGDVVAAPNGDIFFVDGRALERIDPGGQLTLVAGLRCNGTPAPFDAVGNDRAQFYSPKAGIDTDGEPLIVDAGAGRIYRATPDHVLAAPAITGVTTSSGQLTVAWSAPDLPADSSGVRTYTVDAEPGHHDAVVYATTTQVVLRGLDNDQTYTVTVTAQNTAGDSAASAPVLATPGASPPGQPRQLWVDPVAGGLVVHFQAPLDDGGSAITSYDATASPGNITVTVGAGSESATIYGLSHQRYSVTVRAHTAAGIGAAAATGGTPDLVPTLARSVATSPRTHVVLTRPAGVRDVDTADLALTDAGGHRLSVVVACYSGSGARVMCDQQVVARMVVTPRASLHAGARYTLTVNPAGDANPITDLAGNAVPRFAMSFRAGSAG